MGRRCTLNHGGGFVDVFRAQTFKRRAEAKCKSAPCSPPRPRIADESSVHSAFCGRRQMAHWTCIECDFVNCTAVSVCDGCDYGRPPLPSDGPSVTVRSPLQPLCQQPAPRLQAPACKSLSSSVGQCALASATLSHALEGAVAASSAAPPAAPAVHPQLRASPAPINTATNAGAATLETDGKAFAGDGYPWSAEADLANRTVFGSASLLRPLQRQVVNAAMSRRNLLVVLPTGAGKSRCFQLPALLSSGLTVVVAPLLSLITDQIEALARHSVRALHLSSHQSVDETAATFAELRHVPPTAKLLYVTPERLQQSVHLSNCLQRLHEHQLLERIVIDECHCVIAWGKDFSPDYLALGAWRSQFAGVPCTLLSATLPPSMRHELLATLEIEPSAIITVSAALDRPNLFYQVLPKLSARAAAGQVATALKAAPEGERCTIIYCHSQSETERVCDALQARGLRAAYYHAQVDPEVKNLHHRQWMSGEVEVMVATSAFGMGVHKDDVRYVIHWSLPDSIISLYQEWGRAGRDGKPARCLLLYTYRDKGRVESLQRRSTRDLKPRLARLLALVEMCEEQSACRRVPILAALGQSYACTRCENGCDNCASDEPLLQEDVSVPAAAALRAVHRMPGALSFGQLEKILRGSREKKLVADGHDTLPEHGASKSLGRSALSRMLRLLIARRLLREDCLPSSHGGFSSRLQLGPCAGQLWGVSEAAPGAARGEFSVHDEPHRGVIQLSVRGSICKKAPRRARGKAQAESSDDEDDDEDEDDEEEDKQDDGCGAEGSMCDVPCAKELRQLFEFSQSAGAFEPCALHCGGRGACFHRSLGKPASTSTSTWPSSSRLSLGWRRSDATAAMPSVLHVVDTVDRSGLIAKRPRSHEDASEIGIDSHMPPLPLPPPSSLMPPPPPPPPSAAAGHRSQRRRSEGGVSPFASIATPGGLLDIGSHDEQGTPFVDTPNVRGRGNPLPGATPSSSAMVPTPTSQASSNISTLLSQGSGRQDPATVARICELGLAQVSVTEIDKTLHRECHKTSSGTRWPAKNDGRVVVRILLNSSITPVSGDVRIVRYVQEYEGKLKSKMA